MKSDLFGTILNCVLCSLYKNNKLSTMPFDAISTVFMEAKSQAVFPLVYSALAKSGYDLSAYQSQYFSIIGNNVKVTEEHKWLHKLLSQNKIEYVFLKGCASARFYPDPLLRTMGDVDLLVRECDVSEAAALLIENGYKIDDINDNNQAHISLYNQKTNVHIELHRRIGFIPENDAGERIKTYFTDIFEKYVLENNEYLRPSDFHHGLILLLHTAQHLTSEGVGLRHLCDWAVFVATFSDADFKELFEKPLKQAGLWEFAKILTQFAVKYLGCPEKAWCGEPDDAVLEALLCDIFDGGNFGKKDFTRYQHIKYISDRSKDNNAKSPLRQLFSNIVTKTKAEVGFVKKAPLLLPIGVICVGFKYLRLIIIGKRKMDNKSLINKALTRKELYDSFELFK
ncbi:MAG: nucleotidyltransferase family protein [Clostridia bacterium]|nr:nucleotidyltransferase family protein [Clostridia bacterium]